MIEKTSDTTVNKIAKVFNKLSIQVSLNGLSFCILDTVGNTILDSERIVFEKERTVYGLHKGLAALFKKHDLTKKKFSEVTVVHRNNLFSLVPKSLFDVDELANYLKFNTKMLVNDHIAYDELEHNDMVNVYVPFVNINNYIYELFGEFTFKHNGTVMIESLLNGKNAAKEPICYIYVTDQQMDITVISQKKIVLFNSFGYATIEDFIYYLLFTLEQLQIDTETVILKMFGEIEEGDDIYNICYKYVKHISIFVPSVSSLPMDLGKGSIDFTLLNAF